MHAGKRPRLAVKQGEEADDILKLRYAGNALRGGAAGARVETVLDDDLLEALQWCGSRTAAQAGISGSPALCKWSDGLQLRGRCARNVNASCAALSKWQSSCAKGATWKPGSKAATPL